VSNRHKKSGSGEAAYYEFSSIQRNKRVGSCQKWHEDRVLVRGVITMIAFPEPCALKNEILSVQTAMRGFLIFGADESQAMAARTLGDHRLFFHFKIFVDIFAFNAQLTRRMAVWAA
jgi:hypothetical protein